MAPDSYQPDPKRTATAPDSALADAAPKPAEADKGGHTLMGRVGQKLADTAFYNDFGYRPPSLQFSQYGGVGFDMRVKPIKPDDGLIKGDPNRLATTERIKKEGKGVTWAELRGAVNPWVGVPFWMPVGPVNVAVGFSADASIGLSVLAPFRHNLGEAAKNLSVKLPFDADTARDLSEGTELTLRGHGRVAVSAGTRVGDTWVPIRGPWSIGTSVGQDSYVSKAVELAVRVKRLEGEKVFVSLSEVKTDGQGHAVGARAGVHSNLDTLAPELDNKWAEKGKDFAVKRISREIERWLSAEVRAVYSWSESERELKNYVLDLSKPEAKKAYEALMRLDTRAADALDAQGENSGVEAVWLTEDVEATNREFQARFGKIKLLENTARAEYAHGRLFTREGVLRYDRTTLDNRYQDIITRWWIGKRETQRMLVASRSGGGSPRAHLRLRHEVKVDWSTPTSHVRRFMTLARYVGLTQPDPSALEKDHRFLSSFGRSKRVADFVLDDRGLERLLTASDQDLHAAFAAAYEDIDRPWEQHRLFGWNDDWAWRVTPWLNTAHPRHAEVMKLLEDGPEHRSGNVDTHEKTRDDRYYWITGRSLQEDHSAYEEATRLVALVTKLREAPNASERAKILKAQSGDLGVDSIREFATFAKIAGRDGIRVGEFYIKDEGRKKKLEFAKDGPVQDPREVVDAWLANPAEGPKKD